MTEKPTLQKRTIRGLRTAWLEDGDPNRPFLFLLHGYPDSPAIWEDQAIHFENRFHVIRPYIRGLEPSEGSSEISRYGLDAVALDHLEILDILDPRGNKPIYLVGHDLGAVRAWHLSQFIRQRLKSLIIFNGLSLEQFWQRIRHPEQLIRSWYIYLLQVPALPEAVLTAFSKQFLNFAYRTGGLKTAPVGTKQHVKNQMVSPINQYRAFARELPKILNRSFQPLECPVEVIWGKDDPYLMRPSEEEFTPLAKHLTIRILEGGHWIFKEKASEVSQLMDDFWTSGRKLYAVQ